MDSAQLRILTSYRLSFKLKIFIMSLNIIFKVLFWAVEMHPNARNGCGIHELGRLAPGAAANLRHLNVAESNIIADLIGRVHGYLMKTTVKEMWRSRANRASVIKNVIRTGLAGSTSIYFQKYSVQIPGRMWINSGNGYSTSRVLLTENKLDKEGSVTSQKVKFHRRAY